MIRRQALLLFATLLLTSPFSRGADLYWDGSLSGTWVDLDNWSTVAAGGTSPLAVPGIADRAFFYASSLTNPITTLGAPQSALGLVFNADAGAGVTLGTLNDFVLTLGNQGINSQAGAHLINSGITVSANQTWNNSSAGALDVAGNVTLGANLTFTGTGPVNVTGAVAVVNNTITLNGTGPVTFGNMSATSVLTVTTTATSDGTVNGVISGAGSFHKDGPGLLTLNGANTFGGTLRILDGTVKLNTSNVTYNQLIFGNAGGAQGLNGAGVLTLDNNSAVTYRVTLIYVHPTSDGGVINAGGGGSFAPTLALNAVRDFIINDTAADVDLLVSVGIVNGDAGARGFNKKSIGTMSMQGANTYTGVTDIFRGRLILDYTTSTDDDNKLSNLAASTTRMSGGMLELQGNATDATSETVTSLTIGTGSSNVSLVSNGGQALTMSLNAGLVRAVSGGVVNFDFNDAALAKVVAIGGAANNAQGILGGWATVNGDRWATKNGANEVVALTGTVQSNRSLWTSTDHIIADAALTGTLTTPEIASLIFDSPAPTTLVLDNNARALTIASGAVLVSADVGASATGISGGQLMTRLATVGATSELILNNQSAGTFTVAANLGSNNLPLSSTQHLTLAGPGLIVLSGKGVYNGNTAIQGNVRVSGGNALSDYGTLNLATSGQMTTSGAVLDLNGGSEGVGNLTGGAVTDDTYVEAGRGEIRLGTGGTLTINQTTNTSLNARITGSGTVIKRGSATFTTSAVNPHTMTGELRILGGLVDLIGGPAGFTALTTIRIRGGEIRSEQNQTTANADKLPNGNIILEGTSGSGLRVTSNQDAGRAESAAKLVLGAGANTITVDTSNAGAITGTSPRLQFVHATDSFDRLNNATLLARGDNLGSLATLGAGVVTTRITFANAIAADQIGGGGLPGTQNISILPYAIGSADVGDYTLAAFNASVVGDSFVTVGANGLRPLASGEYELNYAAAAVNANLSLSATATGLGSKTLNALRIVTSGAPVDLSSTAGNVLTLTSGALLVSAGATENDATLTGYDQILAGTAAATPDELVVHVTSSAVNAAGAQLTVGAQIVDNGGATSVTKGGGGTLVLSNASNTYTGTTTVNQGVLEFAGAGSLGTGGTVRVSGGTLRWGAGNTADISAGRTVELLGPSVYLTPTFGGNILNTGSVFDVGANNVTLSAAIGNGGHGGLTKTGTGTLTLGAATTYTGNTVINQGTVNFKSIAPNTMEGLYMINPVSGALTANVESGLNLQSLVVGGVYATGPNVNATLTVSGGAVNIGDGGGDDFILLGYRDPTGAASTTGTTTGVADFRLASSVNINVSRLHMGTYLGVGSTPNSLTSTGSLLLSNTSNVITASSIVMGTSPTSVVNSGTASTMNLGTGTTTINADSFVIGGIRSKGEVSIGAGGSFTLRGQQGGDTGANLYIGDNDATGTGTANASFLNLTGAASVDMKVNLLVLGRLGGSTNNGFGFGTLTYGTGLIEATTIRMADANYSDVSGTNPINTRGIIFQSGATTTMRFMHLSQGLGAATWNWHGGIIGNLAATGLTNENVTLTLNGAGAATDPTLRSFDVGTGQTGTFQASAEFIGTGSFTKTGEGSLVLQGANLNSGNVLISAGDISLHTAGTMDDAAWVNVATGARLDISQRTGAAYTSDAVISGTGTIGGTGATFTVGTNVGSVNTVGVLKPGASSVLNSAANAATVGNQTGVLLIDGNLVLDVSGGVRVDRAVLQTGATDRNAASQAAFYASTDLWVDNIPTDFPSFMTGAGTNHDLLDISGTLTLNNTGGITVSLVGGYTGVFGDVFNLLDWSLLQGTYTDNGFIEGNRTRPGGEAGLDLSLPVLGSGLAWDTSLFATRGVVVVVPEPTRGLLMLAGCMALFMRRRRSRRI